MPTNVNKQLDHAKSYNLARRWSVQNENDLMQVRRVSTTLPEYPSVNDFIRCQEIQAQNASVFFKSFILIRSLVNAHFWTTIVPEGGHVWYVHDVA